MDDPHANISIASVGFSRGAAEIPGFTRLVHRYGILDPTDLHFSRDKDGELRVASSRPPLVAAGQVAQAVALFDPVATGIPMDYDRRLPPSVISGFSLLAQDERRRLFPHTALIDPQMTVDGRFLGVTVPGAHSDVGGSYHRNGLEIRAGNLVVDYLNALSDQPFLHKRALPVDPSMTVVHRSEQGMLGLYEIGSTHAGEPRPVREQLCVVVDPCRDAEPRDAALASRFDMHAPSIGPLPRAPAALLDDPRHPHHWRFQQAYDAIARLDAEHGRRPDTRSTRLAAALAARADAQGLAGIDQVQLSDDRHAIFAVDDHGPGRVRRVARLDIAPALQQTLAQSTHALEQVEQQRTQGQVQAQSRLQAQVAPATQHALVH